MSLHGIGQADLGRALDGLLAEPPALLGLGEPTHGIAAFPLLRNDVLAHLVDRGFRSVSLEVDFFAASLVDDYVAGSDAGPDTVLEEGFSHGFGSIPGNRELLDQLRAHNAGLPPRDRVRCYGFDGPLEHSGAASPRRFLTALADFLPAARRPAGTGDLDALLGADADWTNPAALRDPAASVGGSDRARALRLLADDLVSALHRAAPALDPVGLVRAEAHARTALGLLRYHAALAGGGPDRLAALSGLRSQMMAENLLAIAAQERDRGPGLVFAHNAHLRRALPDTDWPSAGALVAHALGSRYRVVVTDANPDPVAGTLQHALSEATDRRALFPADALADALPPGTTAGDPVVFGHIPLAPQDLRTADAVVFVADTDGKRHQYW